MSIPTLFAARLEQHAQRAHGAPAIAIAGREFDYREVLAEVGNCAAWLARCGCSRSEVVGVTIADERLHMIASLALLYLGIPQACLPTHDPEAMRRSLAQRLAVRRAIVADPRHALPGTQTLLLTPDILREARAAPDSIDADPNAHAMYLTGSGTTGDYKIFSMSQRDIAWRAERMTEYEDIPADYRVLMATSVEHPPAKTKRLNTFYLGFTSAFAPASAARVPIHELCSSFDATCVDMSVLQVEGAVREPAKNGCFPQRTTVTVSGSRVSANLRKAFRTRFGKTLIVHYGAREFGRISVTQLTDSEDLPESVGRPLPWVELEIVDADGSALPPGSIGELRVRSECMSHEYYGDPVATARHFRDGWFHPGDLASLTPAGSLCLHGRADDMMILNSIKIFPAEIERVLEEQPGVKAAAAFAKPSRAHGDIPVAAVEPHPSAVLAGDELMTRARERLGIRAPRKIIVLDALPRNAAGKVLKSELLELFGGDR